jgi:AcrR family transcriptional regulator
MAARDTIVTAAATVMREKGIARTTTKEIARAAGYSEALLYKHFADKQEIFMAVLQERVGGLVDPAELVAAGDLHTNLIEMVGGLMDFYAVSFPMSASLFSDTTLLAAWREGMSEKGGGPGVPLRRLEGYLAAEQKAGRIARDVDTVAVAALLCGAAFQHGVLTAFEGSGRVTESHALATRIVAAAGL